MKRVLMFAFTFLAFFLILGCISDTLQNSESEEISYKKASEGVLVLGLTAENTKNYIDITGIYIEVEEIWYQDTGWKKIEGYQPMTYNFLGDMGEYAPILYDVILPAGHYNKLRLVVNEEKSFIKIGTGVENEYLTYPIEIPTVDKRGLDLIGKFDIAGDQITEIKVRLDLEKSLTLTGTGRYILRPVLKVMVSDVIWEY